MVAPQLAAEGLELADELEQRARLDEVADEVLAGPSHLRFRALAEGAGFREALASSVQALRLAGIRGVELARVPLDHAGKRDVLAAILAGYEARLAAAGKADTAAVLRRAAEALEQGTSAPPAARIYLLPGLHRRGLTGRLLRWLGAHGAAVLAADPTARLAAPAAVLWREASAPSSRLSFLHEPELAGLAPDTPRIDLFAAASPTDELREVLRRVLAAGLRWDQVEIVATDAAAYGAALDTLAQRLGIPVSYAVGLPVDRTRPARALAGYFRWLEEGCPAEVLRGLLEVGDVVPPAGGEWRPGPALARRLRRLRIGWGLDRYLAAIEGALEAAPPPALAAPGGEDGEQAAEWARRERAELDLLRSLLQVLEATAPAAAWAGADNAPTSAADIARGALAFLELVPAGSGVDATARARLGARLERVAESLQRPTSFGAALAILRGSLELRVPAPAADGAAPWTSSGAHLHLSDLEHGGLTGRPASFVVGLDAARFPGAGVQDPLLLDEDRRRVNVALAGADLPTSMDRLEEARHRLAALLARLRGQVTLSYSAWEAAEARAIAPAAVLLQALRLRLGDPTADYRQLHEQLGALACAVPAGAARLDAADAWLGALSSDGLLLSGTRAVLAGFPGLRAGLNARRARRRREFTAYHGRIVPRPERLDPRRDPETAVSATRLETLGTCPHRYFYRYILRIRAPEDPHLDPEVWLDPLERGKLLHKLYEDVLGDARRQGIAPESPEFLALTLETLDRRIGLARAAIPVPSEAVFQRQVGELREDARAFVEMVRTRGAPWHALELGFGPGTAHDLVPIELPGGVIRLSGRIDRVDRRPEGLVVVDYKTGSRRSYAPGTGVFQGGRRLQHTLYVLAAEKLLGQPADRAEYHFPTRQGQNECWSRDAAQLRAGLAVIDRLLDLAARGHFMPTDNPDDCKFCDYREICRVGERWGEVDSPLAAWTRQHLAWVPELEALAEVRRSP
ncbi:MAG: PD-(D/E)XK nuclease family protein [Gemmatimonadetes bacterium]|nr:PD-(D/E)XK nuclease family protein [Gemmatimonadota bacterium]